MNVAVVEVGEGSSCQALVGERVRLSWYYPPGSVSHATLLRATAKLRKPWGAKNPGGFDYGLWLIGQGYRASGYVRQAEVVAFGTAPAKLSIDVHRYVHGSLLQAILLGQRDGVRSEQWELFRDTGTIHLMVVSGLHVGVFVGVVIGLVLTVLRCVRFGAARWIPRRVALSFGVVAITLLVYQTGASAPVVRAALMAGGVAVMLCMSRAIGWWRCFLLTAVVAVLIQPQVLLQQGFWLSYAAVAGLLFYFRPRQPTSSWVRGLLACQVVLFLVLVPWLGVTVGEIPLVSPIANVLVVPVMSLVTIPLGMVGAMTVKTAFAQSFGHLCLLGADFSLELVLTLLEKLRGSLPGFGYFDWSSMLLACFGALILLMPVARRVRMLATFGWLALLVPASSGLPEGQFRVLALDVGQGSSAIVDTRRYRLLVDAGPALPSGFNTGEAVVIPALRTTGKDVVDRILISHGDNDHAGGIDAVRQRYPGARVVGLGDDCVDGAQWQWDGVNFRVLRDASGASSNDRSCTLLIDNGTSSAYLSGDVSRVVERNLLHRLPRGIDLLLAPHHGSASSSSWKFVRRLCPGFVVYSAGRANRYGHPRADVQARYRNVGSVGLITGHAGAVWWRSDTPGIAMGQRGKVRRARSVEGRC